jgi:PII-like signaling protein
MMMFIKMVLDDFPTKEEPLTLLPPKSTMRGADVYKAVKGFFWRKGDR